MPEDPGPRALERAYSTGGGEPPLSHFRRCSSPHFNEAETGPLRGLFAQNLLHLRLLVTAQRRAEDRAAVAAELIGHNSWIAHP